MKPLHLDSNFVHALGPEGCTPEITDRLRRLADDLDRIAPGAAPTAADLKSAPLLVDWEVLLSPWRGVCLTGFVAGHPRLGNKRIATSHLWALDPGYRWARTLSRFYRLGLAAGAAISGDVGRPHGHRHWGRRS